MEPKPRTTIGDAQLDAPDSGFKVNRYGTARMSGSVEHGFAGSGHEGFRGVDAARAPLRANFGANSHPGTHRDNFETHRKVFLHLTRDQSQGRAEVRCWLAATASSGKEPLAQLPLLGAGHPGNVTVRAGLLLNKCQGLQHRVVQVSGDIGSFGVTGPRCAFVGQIAPQSQQPRSSHDGNTQQNGCRRQNHRPRVRTGARDEKEQNTHGDKYQRTQDAHEQRRGLLRSTTSNVGELAPREGRSSQHHNCGHHDGQGNISAQATHDQGASGGQQG